MKFYVIPTERTCNGKCPFCITRSRKKIGSEFLDADGLATLSRFRNISAIEITGGGEPSFNRDIREIVSKCCEIAPTRIYTNGTLDPRSISGDAEISLSRAHHDDKENRNIMGVEYDIHKYGMARLKLSLLLANSGIKTEEELDKYLTWAKRLGVKKVVVREMSLQDSWSYYSVYQKEHVRIDSRALQEKFGRFVEFDYDACNPNTPNLILRSDGKIYPDWDSNAPLSEDNFLISYIRQVSLTSTCLGRKVSALIIKDNKILGAGSNSGSDCLETKVCNRVLSGKNCDYRYCLSTHAEVNAINDARKHHLEIRGATIYLFGHHTVCQDCMKRINQEKLDLKIIR